MEFMNRHARRIQSLEFFLLPTLFLLRKIGGIVCAFCENSNVVTIPIISQNKYQERLFNDFIAKKRLESNVFRPLF